MYIEYFINNELFLSKKTLHFSTQMNLDTTDFW